jgi:hypothetical protein
MEHKLTRDDMVSAIASSEEMNMAVTLLISLQKDAELFDSFFLVYDVGGIDYKITFTKVVKTK